METVKDLVLFDDMNPTMKRPIVTEDYNEIVFVDPNITMLRMLKNAVSSSQPIVQRQASQIMDPTNDIQAMIAIPAEEPSKCLLEF